MIVATLEPQADYQQLVSEQRVVFRGVTWDRLPIIYGDLGIDYQDPEN